MFGSNRYGSGTGARHVRVILIAVLAALVLAVGAGAGAMLLGLDHSQARSGPHTTQQTKTPPALTLTAYASGGTVQLVDARFDASPDPGTRYQASPLYVVAYPFNLGACTKQCGSAPSLPSKKTPLCTDPCALPGLTAPFTYQDRIVADAVGGAQPGTFELIAVMYNPTFVYSAAFQPFTSADALERALADPRQAAQDFLPLGRKSDSYEIHTGVLVTCRMQAAK
jgi:hypothetical protein